MGLHPSRNKVAEIVNHDMRLDDEFSTEAPAAVTALQEWLEDSDNVLLRRDSEALSGFRDRDAVLALLVSKDLIKTTESRVCDLGHDLGDFGEVLEGDDCPVDNSHSIRQVEIDTRYLVNRKPRRMVPALVAIHGMNTRGAWQEQFARAITTAYRYPVPIAIHKYGWILAGVVLPWRRKALVKNLRARLLHASPTGSPHGDRPDVIAHSFGTWLLVKALEDESIRVGRVILCGSIVPPDHDWSSVGSRIGPILNHYSRKDFVVAFAPHTIVDSGPSGRLGFHSPHQVTQKRETEFGHSDYFNPDTYEKVWTPFLTDHDPIGLAQNDGRLHPDGWNKPPAFLRRCVVLLIWLIILLVAVLAVAGVTAIGIAALAPALCSVLIVVFIAGVGVVRRWN